MLWTSSELTFGRFENVVLRTHSGLVPKTFNFRFYGRPLSQLFCTFLKRYLEDISGTCVCLLGRGKIFAPPVGLLCMCVEQQCDLWGSGHRFLTCYLASRTVKVVLPEPMLPATSFLKGQCSRQSSTVPSIVHPGSLLGAGWTKIIWKREYCGV